MKEMKKIKLTLTNIRSVLVRANKEQKRSYEKTESLESKKESKEKLRKKEKGLKSPVGISLNNVKNSVKTGSGIGIFDKLFEFLGLLVAGIIANALPTILKKIRELIDTLVDIFTPIQSMFNVVVGLMKGDDFNDSKYDADKKRIEDTIVKQLNVGGLIDKIPDSLKPIKDILNKLQGAYQKKTVLAKQGGKEGFYNKETKTFTEKQWTAGEREEYQRQQGFIQQGQQRLDEGSESSGDPINDTSTTNIKDDHSSNATASGTPSGSFDPGKDKNKQIYLHWTGGTYTSKPSVYHTVITGDGKAHYMNPYSDNTVSHTWRRNSKGVGISAAAMGHTPASPYREALSWAQTPLKDIQVNSMTLEAAKLALAWGWKDSDITIRNVMTHAEAAGLKDGRSPTPNYGPGGERPIRWDLSYLKKGGKQWSGGPILRNMIKQHMKNLEKQGGNSTKGEGGSMNMFTMIKPNQAKMESINQPMYEDLDDQEELVNIIMQPTNTVMTRYSYVPLPQKTQNMNSSTPSRHSQIWST